MKRCLGWHTGHPLGKRTHDERLVTAMPDLLAAASASFDSSLSGQRTPARRLKRYKSKRRIRPQSRLAQELQITGEDLETVPSPTAMPQEIYALESFRYMRLDTENRPNMRIQGGHVGLSFSCQDSVCQPGLAAYDEGVRVRSSPLPSQLAQSQVLGTRRGHPWPKLRRKRWTSAHLRRGTLRFLCPPGRRRGRAARLAC